MDLWEQIRAVREDVGRELEKLRATGSIGSSLDAEVDLYGDEKLSDALTGLDDELRFVLITSYARVHSAQERPADAEPASSLGGRLWIKAMPSKHGKCVRCWHHREDVGTHFEHPGICARCVSNVTGNGETRRYA